jgi:hypothetical protein
LELEKNEENIENAINHFKNSLKVFDEKSNALKWSVTLSSLGSLSFINIKGYSLLLKHQIIKEKDKNILIESIECLNKSLTVIKKNQRRNEFALICFNLSNSYLELFKLDKNFNHLSFSMQFLSDAREILIQKIWVDKIKFLENDLNFYLKN